MPLREIGLQPGKIRWFAVSGNVTGLCKTRPDACLDRAPSRGVVEDEIRRVERVGCTAPDDLAFSHGPRSRKAIALTFDDGPSGYTENVLRILEHKHAKGTFFEIGDQVGGHAEVMRRIVAAGHELANHSMHHTAGPSRDDIAATNRVIEKASGFKPCLFRPPGGYLPGSTAAGAHSLGMTSVIWDIDTRDWTGPGSGAIYSRAVAAQRGSIVLMHDGGGDRSQTVAALPRIISTLRSRGYRLVTVTELIGGRFTTREIG
jgi:peptidoglycan/xylan/chitin deacetylase (PgdA/CDA1 family)